MTQETSTVFKDGPHGVAPGDALEEMRHLPEDSFDLAIADPAYGASTDKRWGIPTDHGLKGFGGEWLPGRPRLGPTRQRC